MLNLRKTALAVLALSSGVAFSGTMGPVCSAVNVTIPCESTAWGFGAKALYLEPATTSGAYNYIAANPTGQNINYPNKWAWGFEIEGSYHYDTGSDANLNWYHVNKSAKKSLSGAYTFPWGTSPATSLGRASIDPKWDAVNLEFGQRVDFGDTKNIRFHGGIEYARLANASSLTLQNPVSSTFNNYLSSDSTYNGFGPRLGTDLNYDWGNGLGIYANGAGAVLVGTSKTSRYSNLVRPQLPVLPVYNSFQSSSHTVISPELEAKLGVTYDYALAQGDLTFDLGWMWINYFNVTSSVLSNGTDVVNGDFGLQGLFFGLKWLGNVA